MFSFEAFIDLEDAKEKGKFETLPIGLPKTLGLVLKIKNWNNRSHGVCNIFGVCACVTGLQMRLCYLGVRAPDKLPHIDWSPIEENFGSPIY